MTCFARRPTLSSTGSLLSLTSMWYIPLLMDPVSSASSQTTPSIPRCTNVLTSSHRLLFSWSRLQPFNFAVGFHLRRQRQQPAIHQLGLVIQWGHRSKAVAAVQAQGSTNGTISRFDLGLSWLEAQSSRPQIREVSWIATPETSDQRLGLHTSTCLATTRDSVCVLHPIHIVASRLVACLSAVKALCSLTDQVLEFPLCQHRGAPLHLHQRCARRSCFEELKRIIVVESHELSVLGSPHLPVVLTALSSSSAIDFCTVAILSTVLDNCSWNS